MKANSARPVVVAFILFLGYFPLLQPSSAQTPLNTITFDNQSGEFAIVKLMGPTKVAVEVPNEEERTVHVEAGDYYLLGRYGIWPEEYTYTKGDPFNVDHLGSQFSVITIMPNGSLNGNYNTVPVSKEEFEHFGETTEEKISQSLETNELSFLKNVKAETSGKILENDELSEQRVDFQNIQSIRIIIKESYQYEPKHLPNYLGKTEDILSKAGKNIVRDEDEKYDATLEIEAEGLALSERYADSTVITGSSLSYEGAKVSGQIKLIHLGEEIFLGQFEGKIAPGVYSYGAKKMPWEAPYDLAFEHSSFGPTLCELTLKVWRVPC